MFCRVIMTAALVSCVATTTWAQNRATYVLTNGEKHNGAIVLAYDNNNITMGKFHVNEGGVDRAFEQRDVAVIDFVGGTPSAAERQALPTDADTGLMVMRDSAMHRGHLHNILGDQVQWVNEGGQRNNFPISDVRRLYLNTAAARNVFFNNTATGTSGVATGQVRQGGVMNRNAIMVRVNGNERWVDTGIDVKGGDRLSVSSSGQVQVTPGSNTTPAGSRIMSNNYPVANIGGGGLIGRVGDGAPFAVGAGNHQITMPEDGRFLLGINDDDFGDNSGAFSVTVRRQ